MLFQQVAALLHPHVSIPQDELVEMLETPPQREMGDVAFPCFPLAKAQRKAPPLIAQELQQTLAQQDLGSFGVRQIQVQGGYVNFFLDRAQVFRRLLVEAAPDAGISSVGGGRTVVIDFSSPNIAKPFGVGHLRSTVIGHSLARIYTALGYEAVRVNHLGDWGTQFGKEIAAYKRWGDEERVKSDPIPELLQLYVRFHEEAEKNPELEEEGRAWFKRLEEGDEEARQLWQWFVEESLKAFRQTYDLLGVEFDHFTGESFYNDKMNDVIEQLSEKDLLVESEGALVVDLSTQEMPPCIIQKQDGTSIYATRDLAAALYRQRTFRFSRLLYVVGGEQALHFKQVFAVLRKMGYEWADNCVHVPFGLMQIEGKKMSTRKGRVIFLEEVLREAIERAEAIIEEKNPGLPNRHEVARQVGVGAVIFHDLKQNRLHNVNFSWEEVLNFDGETGPYVQYTYARTQSLLRRAAAEGYWRMGDGTEGNTTGTGQAGDDAGRMMEISWEPSDRAWEVTSLLDLFVPSVKRGAERYDPSQVARYLLDLCQAFNRFYHDERILVEDSVERLAKLSLTETVGRLLGQGLHLLGLEAPKQI